MGELTRFRIIIWILNSDSQEYMCTPLVRSITLNGAPIYRWSSLTTSYGFLPVFCTYSQVLTLHFVRLAYRYIFSKDITKKKKTQDRERVRHELVAASLSSCTDFKAGIWRIQTAKSLTTLETHSNLCWRQYRTEISIYGELLLTIKSHTQVHQTPVQ